jgi:translation elongation factor EF-G
MLEIQSLHEFNPELEFLTCDSLSRLIIKSAASGHGSYICQTRCPSDFAVIDLVIEPYHGLTQFCLEWTVAETDIPAKFIPAVIEGIKRAASQHPSGFIVNVKVKVVGGAYHLVDSRDRSYVTATIDAFNDALSQTTLFEY